MIVHTRDIWNGTQYFNSQARIHSMSADGKLVITEITSEYRTSITIINHCGRHTAPPDYILLGYYQGKVYYYKYQTIHRSNKLINR